MAATTDSTQASALISVSAGMITVALSTCIPRLFTRGRTGADIGADGWVIGVAALVAFIGTIFTIIAGFASDQISALEYNFIAQPWLMMAATLAKVSICLYFSRYIGDGMRQWKTLLGVLIALVATVQFVCTVTASLECNPIQKLWEPETEGTCWDPEIQLGIEYFQGAVSIFSWLFICVFPLIVVRENEASQTQRWPSHALSSLALVAGVLVTVRMAELSQTERSVYSYSTSVAQLLSVLEQNIGIVAANIPSLGTLVSRRHLLARSSDIDLGRPHSRASVLLQEPEDLFRRTKTRRSVLFIDPMPRPNKGDRAQNRGDHRRQASRGSTKGDDRDSHMRQASRGSIKRLSTASSQGSTDSRGGIVKTVSIQVVKEDVYTDRNREAASRASNRSGEQDW